MARSIKAVPETVDLPSGILAASLGLPATSPAGPRLLIGRREWLSLPGLGIPAMNAKIDSGARSSSLHAEEVLVSPDGATVTFTTYGHGGRAIRCTSPVARFGQVRSSSGIARRRVFIQCRANLPGGFSWDILLSLADRSVMRCPLLLGRRALAGFFLIDPLGSHLLGTRRQLQSESSAPPV